ncbi:hypothetical protein [Candidatus Rhabdochlamydia sp. W815]|nr:hypothetical protein [Candidatus Rhabdochlamydia sp. W815]MCL6756508.1 hypothetical protein [Candidatus Rhabdochlamydia oedothoracis]
MKRKQWTISVACGALAYALTVSAESNLDFYGEYIYLKRNDIEKTTLVKNTTNQTSALSNMRDFDFKSGYRVGVVYTADCTNSLEFNYLHINPWRFNKSVSGNQNLLIPLKQNAASFPAVDLIEEKYRVAFCAGEANYWYYLTSRAQDYFSFATLFGFHYFRLEEKLKLLSITGVPKGIANPYFVNMRNEMFGLQLGCLLQSNPTDVTYWNIAAKAGGMANNLRLEKSLQGKKERVRAGFFTEASAQVGWIPASWVKFYAGYQMVFLYGIGTAPEQISQRRSCIHHDSKTIFQAVFGGMAFTF